MKIHQDFLRKYPMISSGIVLAVLVVGMLYQLSYLPLFEPDESRYVEVSREMLETGEYIIPQLNYEIRLNKPAFYHWILASGMSVMGVNPFAARFLSILASMGILLSTGWFAWRHIGKDAKVPLSIAILGSSALFWWMSRIAMVDIFLCLCVCSALFLLYEWEQNRERMRFFWFAAFMMALGVNLKGPVALALPVFIYGLYVALKGEIRAVWKAAPWGKFLLVVFLLSIPWYLIATLKMGSQAGKYFFVDELYGRFFTNKFNRARPFYYYFMMAPLILLPWPILAFRAFWIQRVFIRSQGVRYWARNNPVQSYLIVWALGTFLFFFLCNSKMVHYLIPMLPPIALMTADWLDIWSRKRIRFSTWSVPLFLLLLIGGAVIGVNGFYEPAQSGIPLLIVCAIGMVLYVGYLSFFRFTGYFVHLLGLILVPICFNQLVITGLVRDQDIWPTDIEFSEFVGKWSTPDTEIYSMFSFKPSLLTAVKHSVHRVNELFEIEQVLQEKKPTLLLMREIIVEAVIHSDIQEENRKILRENTVPFDKFALVYNQAYADAHFLHEKTLPLEPKGSIRLVAMGAPAGIGREPYELNDVLDCLTPSPDAVLLLGDNVFLHPSRKYRRMNTVFENPFKQLLEKEIPFFATLGNFDQPISDWLTQYPLFNMEGKRYYSKTFWENLADCFFLDSGHLQNVLLPGVSPQIEWLTSSLTKSKSLWKIISLHHPLYSISNSDETPQNRETPFREILAPVLEFYRVPIVLSGHGHFYSRNHIENDRIQFVLGEGVEENHEWKDADGTFSYNLYPVFLVMDLFEDRIQTTAISSQGETVDRFVISADMKSAKLTRMN